MRIKTSFLYVFVPTVLLFSGCFTQLDLVDRAEHQDYYYGESDDAEADTAVVGEYYLGSDCCYDPYYDSYGYWDPWWYYPRWGLFIGNYPWYPWRYSYYHSSWPWWYYNDYYSYWYYPAYGYYSGRRFQKRAFNRRSPYKRSTPHNRLASRASNDKLLTESSTRPVRSRNESKIDLRNRTRPSIRNDRTRYRGRPVIRKSSRKQYSRSSSSRRPSFSSGRSPSFRSSGRSSGSRSSRSSRSRSNNTSSRGSSRR